MKERETDHVIGHWRYLGTVKCKVPQLMILHVIEVYNTLNFNKGYSLNNCHLKNQIKIIFIYCIWLNIALYSKETYHDLN